MIGEIEIFVDLSKYYKDFVFVDFCEVKSFEWYLEEVYVYLKIVCNVYQCVVDMFDFYGICYDEDVGVVEYFMVFEDFFYDGENVFYGCEVYELIYEFVNKVKLGVCGFGFEKCIKFFLGFVGFGKFYFDWIFWCYFEDYMMFDEGWMYIFWWMNFGDVICDQDFFDDVVQLLMNQDLFVLFLQEQCDVVIEQLNENFDVLYIIWNDQVLDFVLEFYMDWLFVYYDDDLEEVVVNYIEVI